MSENIDSPNSSAPKSCRMPTRKAVVAMVMLLLVVATVASYWPLWNNDFINFDDNEYITENPYVKAGLTRSGIIWAFTDTSSANWFPLTWLSHMLDCELYGLSPRWHHLTNLLLHLANTLGLFWLLRQMTHTIWRSGLVAALFAVHPLHVESVAWAAERKDVLSMFFWVMAILVYVRFTQRRGWKRYTAVAVVVTLPFVLLVLDYWPLQRWRGTSWRDKSAWFVIVEKIPLLCISAIFSLLTFLSQQQGGAMNFSFRFDLKTRIANALISYVTYISQMFWPTKLALFYPRPEGVTGLQVGGLSTLLIGITIVAIWMRRRRPFLIMGWLWYIGTLVPVIGLVQIGMQSHADRYTYIPLIGLFVMTAWVLEEMASRSRLRKIVLSTAASLAVLALVVCTWFQVGHWKNSVTVFSHAVAVTERNATAYFNLGNAHYHEGKIAEAATCYLKALESQPFHHDCHYNLGNILASQGKYNEATVHYKQALQTHPNFPEAHNNLGLLLQRQGNTNEAKSHFEEAFRINPNHYYAHNNLAMLLAGQGQLEKAIEHAKMSLRINPNFSDAHVNLGGLLGKQGKYDEAIKHYAFAAQSNPNNGYAFYSWGLLLWKQGKLDEAISKYQHLLRLFPRDTESRCNIAAILAAQGKRAEAVAEYQKALEINPNHARARRGLASLSDQEQ
jgi:tetratricopeptide (TPR) repeat protein